MPVTPVITIKNASSTLTTPWTVFVDASLSTFIGINKSDCLFKWDFGEPSVSPGTGAVDNAIWKTENFKNKVNLISPKRDKDTDATGLFQRSYSLNSDQRSITASYTYYRTGTYTITLSIIYGGVVISSTTTSITVSSPSVTNNAGGWTNVYIDRSRLSSADIGGVLNGSPKYFSNIDDAVIWANTYTTGKVIFNMDSSLINSGVAGRNYSKRNYSVSSTIQLNVSDVVFIGSSSVMYSSNYEACIFLSAPSSDTSGTPILKLGTNVKNVYFENISFGDSDFILGPGITASNSNWIGVKTSTGNKDITFKHCLFIKCKTSIYSDDISQLNISDCSFYKTNDESLYLANINYSCILGNSFADVGNTLGALCYNPLSYVCFLYGNNISFCENTIIQTFNTESNKGSSRSTGGLLIRSSYLYLMDNILDSGSNYIYGIFADSRIDGNMIVADGLKSCLEFNTQVVINSIPTYIQSSISNINIVNNSFTIGNGWQYANAISTKNMYSSSPSSTINNLNIVNNTFVLKNTVHKNSAVCDLSTQSSLTSITNVRLTGNLFVENGAFFVSRYVKTNSNTSYLTMTNNIFPLRNDNVPFFMAGSTDYTYTSLLSSLSSFFTSSARKFIDIYMMQPSWDFKLSKSSFPEIDTYSTFNNIVNRDYNYSLRSSSLDFGVGCSKSYSTLFPANTGNPFSISFTKYSDVSRSLDSSYSGTTDNAIFSITDSEYQVKNISGSNTNFPILSQSSFGLTGSVIRNDSNIGSYIKTDITSTTYSNGLDINITYTNIGPSNQISGDSRQSIGGFDVSVASLGRFPTYIDDRSFSNFNSYHNPFDALITEAWVRYPIEKFSPTTILLNHRYSIGISIIYNILDNNRYFTQGSITPNTIGIYREDTKGQRWRIQYEWINAIGDGSDPNVINRNKLLYGESFSFKISIRLNRNPVNFVETIKPYKDFFLSSYGECDYAKDVRPILGLVPGNTGSIGSPFYFSMNISDNPSVSSTGWEAYKNTIISMFSVKKFERIMCWPLSGMYGSYPSNTTSRNDALWNNSPQNPFNYTSLYLTPLFTDTAPHNFPVYSKIQSTRDKIKEAIQYIPEFMFYQGYGTTIHKKWNPLNSDLVKIAGKLNDSSIINYIWKEMDLGSFYFLSSAYGMDAFDDGIKRPSEQVQFLTMIKDRYPNLNKLLTETSLADYINRMTSNYIFGVGSHGKVSSSPIVQNYILPGNETCVFLAYPDHVGANTRFNDNTISYLLENDELTRTDKYVLTITRAVANMGYTVGLLDNPTLDTSSLYESTRREFEYSGYPVSDYPTLSAPSSLGYQLIFDPTDLGFGNKRRLIKLTWKSENEPDIYYYIVYKAQLVNGVSDTGLPYIKKCYTKNKYFYDNSVENGKTYSYYVVVVDYYGNTSSASSTLSVQYLDDDPVLNAPSPTSLIRQSLSSVKLDWSC